MNSIVSTHATYRLKYSIVSYFKDKAHPEISGNFIHNFSSNPSQTNRGDNIISISTHNQGVHLQCIGRDLPHCNQPNSSEAMSQCSYYTGNQTIRYDNVRILKMRPDQLVYYGTWRENKNLKKYTRKPIYHCQASTNHRCQFGRNSQC